MPAELASQTLAFLFTDIEGSARLWEQHHEPMREALERHDAILRTAVESSNGQVVKNTGDGFMAVFDSAADGVSACLRAQQGLACAAWGEISALRVRMALHAGEAAKRNGDYFGPTLNRTARVMSAGHGGQVLLSAAAAALVVDHLPSGSTLRDLGEHRLKDLGRPERVFQLVHPDLPTSFPPLVTLSRRRHELPDQPSAFIGRAEELNEIRERLEDASVRLLTLRGPGGIGKTRLAIQGAREQRDRFEDGALFVDLSAARDSASVLGAIARAIGLSDTEEGSLFDEVSQELREQRVLLVLDNFEQATAAAPTATGLLSACPQLKLLVTSREALRVRGEHLFVVPPLSLPSGPERRESAEQLARYEAIQLFVDRARAVRPDFRLTDDNAADVVEICLRVDGLPLAIELATARMNLFSTEALRERLSSRLELLGSGAQDLPTRQQTLRSTIDWSYQLLDPSERRLFELLSVFSGVSFDAVESVAGSIDGVTATGVDTLDGLASLADKSLIQPFDPGAAEPRLVMLETIREYAAERLDDLPDFRASAHRAHALYFADFAQQQWERLADDQRETAQAALAAEIENLRLAWRYWLVEENLEHLNKLVDGLWFLYDTRGLYQATIELTTELLDVLSSKPATPERAMQEVTLRTSLARALMAMNGYTQEVEDAYTRALDVFEGERELPQLFPVLRGLASFYTYRAEFDKGAEVGREILRLADAHDDPSVRADGHLVVGSSLAFQRDLHAGLEHVDKAIASYVSRSRQEPRRFRLGNDPGVASLTTSALMLWMLGFPDRARERARRAVALAMELEHPFTLAYALFHNGFLHLWRREPELVRHRAVGVLDVADEHDLPIWSALGSCLLGAAQTGLGHSEEGLAAIRDGIASYQGLKTPPVFWPLILFMQAGACARSGRPDEGLMLLEEAIEIGDQGSGMTLLPELYSLKGDLLLLSDRNDRTAESLFERSFDMARDIDARMLQLRAAVRLCRSQREPGKEERGRELLSSVYAGFTEGFATADLIEAAELLEIAPRSDESARQ